MNKSGYRIKRQPENMKELPETPAQTLADALGAHEERRLHPHSWLFVLLSLFWQVSIPLVFSLMSQIGHWRAWLAWALLVAALLPVFALLHFLTYRFAIRGNDIVIRHGIVFRQSRYIPLAKIHNVSLRRNPLHRLLDVAEVRLESGGTGAQSEALLRVLSLADAQACERILRQQTTFRQPENTTQPENQMIQAAESNLLPLSTGDLIRYGLLSANGLGLGSFIALVFFQFFDGSQWLATHLEQWFDWYEHSNHVLTWLVSAVALFIAFVLGKLSAIVAALISHGRFSLTFTHNRISQSRGLFTQIHSHLPPEKIQAWRIHQSPLARLMGRYRLVIDTAVTVNNQNDTARGISELIPIANTDDLQRLLHQLGGINQQPDWQPLHPKAWRRIWFRMQRSIIVSLLILTGLTTLVYITTPQAWLEINIQPWRNPIIIFLLTAWLISLFITFFIARASARYSAWALDKQGFLHWRGGIFWRYHHIAHRQRLHNLRLHSNPFDRRHKMMNLDVDTRGTIAFNAPMRLRHLPQATANQLAWQLMPLKRHK